MKKQTIPNAENARQALSAMKNNLDYLTGRSSGELYKLLPTATNSEIINKINEIIERLNFST